jgi:hypothetical protein
MKSEQIVVTALITVLMLWVQHWGIAQVFGRRFHQLVNYTLGVLAIFVPLAFLFWEQGSFDELASMVVVIVSAGAAVLLAYAIDHASVWLRKASRARNGLLIEKRLRQEAEERERTLLMGLQKAIGSAEE